MSLHSHLSSLKVVVTRSSLSRYRMSGMGGMLCEGRGSLLRAILGKVLHVMHGGIWFRIVQSFPRDSLLGKTSSLVSETQQQ